MSPIIFGLILIQLLAVAWIDLKTHKISNRWAMLNVLLSVVFHIFFRSYYPLDWEVLLFPVGFIVIGFFLFLFNIMGAGDSKYLASLFLIVPVELHLGFFERLLLSTMLVGAFLLTAKVIKNFTQLRAYFIGHYWSGIKGIIKSRFSYAPVILIAWIILGVNQWR